MRPRFVLFHAALSAPRSIARAGRGAALLGLLIVTGCPANLDDNFEKYGGTDSAGSGATTPASGGTNSAAAPPGTTGGSGGNGGEPSGPVEAEIRHAHLFGGNVCLSASSAASGAAVDLNACGGQHQQFVLNDTGNGWYEITLSGTTQVLEADSGELVLGSDNDSDAQRWRLVPRGDSRVALRNLADTSLCLDAFDGGIDIRMWGCDTTYGNQEFELLE